MDSGAFSTQFFLSDKASVAPHARRQSPAASGSSVVIGATAAQYMLQACILLASHTPAKINTLVNIKATALTIMRCRYSSSLSGHSYFARSGTGE